MLAKMPEIVIVGFDDWVAVYFDGLLKTQGHTAEIEDILELLEIPFSSAFVDIPEILDEFGYRCPEDLGDLKCVFKENNIEISNFGDV